MDKRTWKMVVVCAVVLLGACGGDESGAMVPEPGDREGDNAAGMGGDGSEETPSDDPESLPDPVDGEASLPDESDDPDPEPDGPEEPEDPPAEAGPGLLEAGGPEPGFLEVVEDGWQVMLTADWEMEPGTEGYYCARKTLDQDVYFNATVPLSPLGTHHTLLSIELEPSAPDGIAQCNAGTNGDTMIAGSGVGTEELKFPDGVAMLAPKGSQVILNLHLYNPTEELLKGRSGTLVRILEEDEVEELAVTTLAGPIQLDIPGGRVVQTGQCTFNRDVTLVVVGPHMHQLGVYMKIVAHSSEAGDVVLYDDVYDFEEQRLYNLDSIPLKAGDTVEVECTYENDTGKTVNFGDSSFAEMCFAGLSHYPARDATSFICTR